jgi:hypothetical protein
MFLPATVMLMILHSFDGAVGDICDHFAMITRMIKNPSNTIMIVTISPLSVVVMDFTLQA